MKDQVLESKALLKKKRAIKVMKDCQLGFAA